MLLLHLRIEEGQVQETVLFGKDVKVMGLFVGQHLRF